MLYSKLILCNCGFFNFGVDWAKNFQRCQSSNLKLFFRILPFQNTYVRGAGSGTLEGGALRGIAPLPFERGDNGGIGALR